MKKKLGKIGYMIALLKDVPITEDELVERTKLSKGTVNLYINYELKKLGHNIKKVPIMGKLAYQIEEKND